MTLDAKGEFYAVSAPDKRGFANRLQTAHPVEAPYTPSTLPDIVASGAGMIQVIVGEYVPNTGAYAMWTTGTLSLLITQDMIPRDSPIQLNTSSWGGTCKIFGMKLIKHSSNRSASSKEVSRLGHARYTLIL
jgi:hypothetical protein